MSDEREMNIQNSRQYLLTVMTEIKRLKMEISKTDEDINLWQGRVNLAREKDRNDLQAQAEVIVRDLLDKKSRLETEYQTLAVEIETEKRKLEQLKNSPSLSVDADLLLAQFEMLLGEPDTLSEKFRDEEAEEALKKLKRQINDE